MQILAVDIGTGTQDILLFDSTREIENNTKLVMPSPTARCAQDIRAATARQEAILLSGVMMGGGPCTWAAEAHVRAGLALYATPDAARTFNDDLEQVERELGVHLVSEDDAQECGARTIAMRKHVTHIRMGDLDLAAIQAALKCFGVPCRPDLLAVAVFDHGNAPPGYSDRQFRFDYLKSQITHIKSQTPALVTAGASVANSKSQSAHEEGIARAREQLARMAFQREAIPPELTRFQAVARSARAFDGPLVLMDTAPAAVLGALEDEHIHTPAYASASPAACTLVANVGNFHTLAFRLGPAGIEGMFEHHTGELSAASLEGYLCQLAAGTLSHQAVFDHMGHGALMLDTRPRPIERLVVTGPRWGMLRGSALHPYYAVPYGDMMLAGCYGLLRACANAWPELAEEIEARLVGFSRHG
ncbi:MAG: hypothetical protein JW850_00365 [Thermoflexales bacterium]|nr:hypothetical protein [Thermoflexales bacterium]